MPAPTETNPSVRRPTFETHAQPAMTNFISTLTREMEGGAAPDTGTPSIESPATPPPETPPAKPESKPESAERPWPRNAKDWDAYKKADKERLDKIASEAREWQAKYEAAEKDWKAKPAVPADYETLKKERDEFDKTLRTVAVENHPKFKQYFDGKINEQLALAEKIGGDKGKEIVELLKAPESSWRDQQLSDLMTTLNSLQSTRIGAIQNTLDSIQSERSAAIAKAKESHDQILQQEQGKAKERQQQAETLFNSISAGLQDPKTGLPAFQLRDNDQKWNDSVKARVESARALLFGQQEPQTMIKTALDAVAFPAVLEQARALLDENAQLKTQLKELQSTQPTVEHARNGTAPSASPVPVRLGNLAHRTPQDAVAGYVQGLRAAQEEAE